MNLLQKWPRKSWRLVVEVLIVAAIFSLMQTWQSRGLLPADGSLKAPGFSGKTLDGGDYRLDGASGKKKALYFFAPWCSVCQVMSPNINALAAKSPGSLEVVAVALSFEKASDVSAFTASHALNVPVVLGNDALMNAYNVQAFPTVYFLNEQGFITGRSVGYTTTPGLWLRTL